jgi:hypothetical protein
MQQAISVESSTLQVACSSHQKGSKQGTMVLRGSPSRSRSPAHRANGEESQVEELPRQPDQIRVGRPGLPCNMREICALIDTRHGYYSMRQIIPSGESSVYTLTIRGPCPYALALRQIIISARREPHLPIVVRTGASARQLRTSDYCVWVTLQMILLLMMDWDVPILRNAWVLAPDHPHTHSEYEVAARALRCLTAIVERAKCISYFMPRGLLPGPNIPRVGMGQTNQDGAVPIGDHTSGPLQRGHLTVLPTILSHYVFGFHSNHSLLPALAASMEEILQWQNHHNQTRLHSPRRYSIVLSKWG